MPQKLGVLFVSIVLVGSVAPAQPLPELDGVNINNQSPQQPEQQRQPEPAAPADQWSGTYEGNGLSVQLAVDDRSAGTYRGQIVMGEQKLPLRAQAGENGLNGQFQSGDSTFAFRATLDGDTLTLTSGESTYQLKRAGAAREGGRNPLERANPINPLGPGNQQNQNPQPTPQPAPRAPQTVRVAPGVYQLSDSSQTSQRNQSPQMTFAQDTHTVSDYQLRVGQADQRGRIPVGLTLLRTRIVITVNGMQVEFDTQQKRMTDLPIYDSLRSLVGQELPFFIVNGRAEMDNLAMADLVNKVREQDRVAALNLQTLMPKLEKVFLLLPPMNYTSLAPPAGAADGHQWKAKVNISYPEPYMTVEAEGTCQVRSNGRQKVVGFKGKWNAPMNDAISAEADVTIEAAFDADGSMPTELRMQSENTIVVAQLNSTQTGSTSATIQIARQ